jgi:hypothetical protein
MGSGNVSRRVHASECTELVLYGMLVYSCSLSVKYRLVDTSEIIVESRRDRVNSTASIWHVTCIK